MEKTAKKLLVTRRSAITKIGALTFGIPLVMPSYNQLGGSKDKKTAFALIGDNWHNTDYIRAGLGKTLVKEEGLSIDFTDEVTSLNASTLKGYKMLILLLGGIRNLAKKNMSYPLCPDGLEIISDPPLPEWDEITTRWITPEQGKAVRDYVWNGGSALLYHNATDISKSNQDFRDVVGGEFDGHTTFRPFRVKITNRNHPITKGVNDFTITEEQHFPLYDKGSAYVFMEGEGINENGKTFVTDSGKKLVSGPQGWAYDYGKGRVCYLGPGHMLTVLWNPEYEKIQKNAKRWLLREI